jgi:hypothetical protein
MHLRFDGPVFSGWAPFPAADAAGTMACCLKFLTCLGVYARLRAAILGNGRLRSRSWRAGQTHENGGRAKKKIIR